MFSTITRIIDSEFIEEIKRDKYPGTLTAIIKCYESRKLDVAHNLFLYYLTILNDMDCISLSICHSSIYIPEYKKYASDLHKYVERYKKIKAFY